MSRTLRSTSLEIIALVLNLAGVNGRPPNAGATANVRVVMVWRKEADGTWRMTQEVFVPDSQSH